MTSLSSALDRLKVEFLTLESNLYHGPILKLKCEEKPETLEVAADCSTCTDNFTASLHL